MKYLGLCSPGLQIFFEKFVKLSSSPPTYLMLAPLLAIQTMMNIETFIFILTYS